MKAPIQLESKTPLFAIGLMAAISLSSVNAASLLFDDFESYTAGSNLGAAANWNTDNRGGAPAISNNNDFGASNQFVDFSDGSTTGFSSMVSTTSIASGQAFTFSLDFIAANDQGISFGLSAGTAANNVLGSDRVLRANLTNGSISGENETNGFGSGFFSLNTAYQLKLVVNDSGATVDYAGRSVADNSYDVWIRDLTASGSTYVGTGTFTSAAQYHTVGRSFNAPTPTTYIDNWSVEEGAIVTPVPEPSMVLLSGLGSLLLLRRRRA